MLQNPEWKNRFRFALRGCHAIAPLALAFSGMAFAQCPVKEPEGVTATYPGMPGSAFAQPLNYPMPSDRYAVQYSIDGGAWTPATVHISYYGGTTATPYLSDSKYPADTSMSFVSIPARASAFVQLRVTKLFTTPFQRSDHVSVRPSVKFIETDTLDNGTVQISTVTNRDFAGEQFILWWDRGTEGGAIQSLAFFLNPPYPQPVGGNVKRISSWSDLNANLQGIDTLDFEGIVAVDPTGPAAHLIPDSIQNVFLGEGAWVQGKLQFNSGGTATQKKKIYGPGVLDVSRFHYDLRVCDTASTSPDEGLNALSIMGGSGLLDNAFLNEFLIDGIVITDHNHAATNLLVNTTVNNVKTLGWNAVNGGLRIGNGTTVSNQFIRSGDDSLMVWGSNLTVTNATVWQNYNGGVVNLGWSDTSTGEYCRLDGLYVVKTDWHTPTNPSFRIPDPGHVLNGQNNAVFASLMIPGTQFDTTETSVFRNIFVEDPPQVLFSLQIIPPDCGLIGLGKNCPDVFLTTKSKLNLNIENLFSPQSTVANSIGFGILEAGYTSVTALGTQYFASNYTLTGSMDIGLTNVFIKAPPEIWLPLTSADALLVGKINTSGNVNIKYSFGLP
jgi:hypothetical protein